jgi:hypothetical protein
MTQAENALNDHRIEWAEEPTPGEFPTDADWNGYSNEVTEFGYTPDGNKEPRNVIGQIDAEAHDRATEGVQATLNYRMARFPVDNSGAVVDPIAYPITEDASGTYPSHTVVVRQEHTDGGALGAGYREFSVISGARPISASFDGDPSATEPIPQELGYEAERGRTHVVHQPSGSSTLVVKSTDPSDTNDVIIESEGAATTETVTLPGADPNTVETTSDFDDIDAIEVQGEHAGDIMLGTSDGSGSIDTELIEDPFTGTNTDGVDSILGIPALGSGSHASTITETGPQFLGTSTDWDGSALADRVHTLSLSVEREVSREPRQTTRRESIDIGPRSSSIDADLAGPYETATRIKQHFRDKSGDVIWTFDNGETITAKNSEITDAPDFTRSAGDTNYIPSVTLMPRGDPAITISKA